MGRIRKGAASGRARTVNLFMTIALIVGIVVPVSGSAIAAVDGDPGTTLDPFTQSELDTNWEADRFFPTGDATSVTAFGRDDVARIGIDNSLTQPGTFQRTEGIKTLGTGFFGRSIQVDLYLDPDWAGTAVRAGLWVVGDDGTGSRDDWFGIIEFINNEICPDTDCSNQGNITDHEGFRIWDSNIGWAEDLATPFTYGTWVTLGITLDAANEQYVYTIDGVEVGTAGAGSHYIREVFLNSYNYGEDSFPTLTSDSYAAHWNAGTESPIVWTTELVFPGDMNDWGFGFDSGSDGSGSLEWGPGFPPVGGGSAYFELGDAATGYVLATQAHGVPAMAFGDITALEYSTYRSAGGAAEAVALQFNVDYDLTDTTASWQGRLVYEPYHTQTVLDDTWQTWNTMTGGANWWSSGTPKVGDATATKYCTMAAPCTWSEVLMHYPDAGIQDGLLAGVLLKAGSAWAGFQGYADELKIATGTTGTVFDFDPYAGGNCVVDAAGGGDFLLLEPAINAQACSTIEVRAGEYVEEGQVVIDRDVTIIGDDTATTIFNTDSDTGTSGDTRAWFLVESGDVNISNVTFDGTGHKIYQAFRHKGTGSFDNVAFKNIEYDPSTSYLGIAIAAFGGVGDVDVTNSTFSQIGRVGVLYFGAGQTGLFQNNTYTGKGVGDWIDYALDISAGANIVVDGNVITMNRGTASSDGSASAGLLVTTYFGAGTIADLTGNTFDDNTMGVTIGYDDSDTSTVTMTGNTFSNNDTGISLTADDAATASSANRNAIFDNTTGVENGGATTFDTTCNWWGDASGPDGTYGGSGDPITGPVDELPWLQSADLEGDCFGGFPVIEGLDDIEVPDAEEDGEVVEFAPNATSVIDGVVAVTCDPTSGSTFFVGETTVECEATDSASNTTTGTFTVTVTFVAGPPSTVRYEGSDRYGTAAAISQADFPDPGLVDTVMVAVGTDYPDGLTAAATAGGLGVPLLLVQANSIPTATANELTRLDPSTIVIVGGPAVVSASVETSLGGYAADVIRLSGADRYATAVEVSQWAFPSGATEVMIALGTNYPDAITGGAAAAAVGGPMLLVPNGFLPNVVRDEVIRLGATQITIIGGPSAVSPDVFVALSGIASTQRISGSNRYATAAAVSQYAFPGTVGRVYMAVGTDFPDALVGAAAAGASGSPVLLMNTDELPGVIEAEILRLDPTEVIILGGTAAISAAMETYLFNLIQ